MTSKFVPMAKPPSLVWTRDTERVGLGRSRMVYSTITTFNDSRNIQWCVYKVGPKQWALGLGIVGEHGLHTVIDYLPTMGMAQDNAARIAVLLGHKFRAHR